MKSKLKAILSIISISLSTGLYAEWELTEACAPHAKLLEYAEDAIYVRLEEMREEFSGYLDYPEVTDKKKLSGELNRVISRIECMQKKHSKIKIVCEESKRCEHQNNDGDKFNIVAHVNWVGRTIHACPNLFSKKRKKKSLRNVLIHEMSHLCGALDLEYLKNSKTVKTYPREQYSDLFSFPMNADNYDYWSGHGACLPGIDCPESTREWYGFKDLKHMLEF